MWDLHSTFTSSPSSLSWITHSSMFWFLPPQHNLISWSHQWPPSCQFNDNFSVLIFFRLLGSFWHFGHTLLPEILSSLGSEISHSPGLVPLQFIIGFFPVDLWGYSAPFLALLFSAHRYISKKIENICSHKNVDMDVPQGIIHHGEKWRQSTCPSTDDQINKTWYIHTILFSHKRE